MKVIIAGSRDVTDYGALCKAIEEAPFEVTHLISGGARGVDSMAEKYAKEREMPITIYPAQWSKHGKRAGPIRNSQMAEVGEALVALWDGESRGTGHMIDTMNKQDKATHVVILQSSNKVPLDDDILS